MTQPTQKNDEVVATFVADHDRGPLSYSTKNFDPKFSGSKTGRTMYLDYSPEQSIPGSSGADFFATAEITTRDQKGSSYVERTITFGNQQNPFAIRVSSQNDKDQDADQPLESQQITEAVIRMMERVGADGKATKLECAQIEQLREHIAIAARSGGKFDADEVTAIVTCADSISADVKLPPR